MGETAAVKVSIMMLAYNHGDFIRQALESVLMQQTDFEYELLIGEDCSTDNTAEIIREMEPLFKGRMKPIFREKNVGMVQNSVDTLMRMRGEYWAFLEGDDFWTDPHKLQKQADFLDGHPEYAACYHKNKLVDENNNVLKEVMPDYPITGEYTLEHYCQFRLPGQTATAMIRGKCIRKTDVKVKYTPGDTIMPLCALANGKIYCGAEVMSAYRTVSLSKKHTSWMNKFDPGTPFGARWFFRMIREMEQLGAEMNLAVDIREMEAERFREGLGHLCLGRYGRHIGFLVNIPYLIYYSSYRGYMIRKGTKLFLQDCVDALKGKLKKK